MGSCMTSFFSHDEKGKKYLLVADGEDNVIWIVSRSDGAIVGTFGHAGRNAASFTMCTRSLRIQTETCTQRSRHRRRIQKICARSRERAH